MGARDKHSEPASILVVDDDRNNRDLLLSRLSRKGYEMHEAAGGQAALDKVTAGGIDLVLLDLMMPEMDGMEVLRRLREQHSPTELPVIMVTASDERADILAALSAGANDYVVKPVDLTILISRVEVQVGLHQAENRLRQLNLNLEERVDQRTVELHQALDTQTDILNGLPAKVALLDNAGKIIAANQRWLRFSCDLGNYDDSGGESDYLAICKKAHCFTDENMPQLVSDLEAVLSGKRRRLIFEHACRADGEERHYNVTLQGRSGAGAIAMHTNITELKQAEQHIEHLAYFDQSTGLPNLRLFTDRVTHFTGIFGPQKKPLAILTIRLSKLGLIKETLGQTAADKSIDLAAQRLAKYTEAGDTIARTGPQEFSILITWFPTTTRVSRLAQQFLTDFKAPLVIENHEFHLSANIGICLFPENGDDPETLLKNVTSAVRQAIAQGGNSYRFFTADMNATAMRRLSLEKKLRRALDNEELLIYLQPQIAMDTGRIEGAEALVRWQPPDGKLISPGEFIPLAEETGLDVPLGEWVLHRACTTLKKMEKNGFPVNPFSLSVNFSRNQMREPKIVEMVDQVLAETSANPRSLKIELLENIVMENVDQLSGVMDAFRERGLGLALDDFGTGHSSLSSLSRFPIETLKVDRSFIIQMTRDPKSAAIVQAVIALAHSMELRVIAEGMDAKEQLAFLRACQCDSVQGFYFARPMPVADFLQLMVEEKTFNTNV